MIRGSCLVGALLGLALAPPSAPAQEILRFQLLPEQSRILTFIKDPFGQTVTSTLTLKEGEAQGSLGDLKGTGRVRVVFEAASYDSGSPTRDPDVQYNYFQVEKYPLISFRSTAIEEFSEAGGPQGPWQISLRGNLELHGVRREVLIPVRLAYDGKTMTAEGGTSIALQDFNMAVPTLLFLFRAGERVEVKFRFVGARRS